MRVAPLLVLFLVLDSTLGSVSVSTLQPPPKAPPKIPPAAKPILQAVSFVFGVVGILIAGIVVPLAVFTKMPADSVPWYTNQGKTDLIGGDPKNPKFIAGFGLAVLACVFVFAVAVVVFRNTKKSGGLVAQSSMIYLGIITLFVMFELLSFMEDYSIRPLMEPSVAGYYIPITGTTLELIGISLGFVLYFSGKVSPAARRTLFPLLIHFTLLFMFSCVYWLIRDDFGFRMSCLKYSPVVVGNGRVCEVQGRVPIVSSFSDATYVAAQIHTTVGYGDFQVTSNRQKIMMIIHLLVVFLVITGGITNSVFVED